MSTDESKPGSPQEPAPDLAELQRVKDALAWREAELRATLYSIGDAVIAADANGCVTLMNPVAEHLTGWSEAEATGRVLDEVFHILNEETRRPVESPAARAMRDGVVVGLANHTLLIGRDGTERPISDCAAPIRDAAGRFAGVVLVFRDQTREREREREVAEARAFAESIIATVREPLLVLDGELRVVAANRAFYRTFQTDAAATLGRPLYELGAREWDVPALRQLLEAVLPQNTSFDDFQIDHDFPRLGRRVMLLNARRLYREAERTDRILLAIEDVTARRQAEEAASRAAAHLARVCAVSPAVLYTMRIEGGQRVPTWVSDNVATILGYTAADVLQPGWWAAHLHPDDRDAALALGPGLAPGDRVSQEYRFFCRDGRMAWVRDEIHVLPDSPDLPGQLAGAWMDVSERRRLEEQYVQAQKMETVGRLAGGVAHDFNNLLAVVAGTVDLALMDVGSRDPLKESLLEIRMMVERAAALTRQLLALSRHQPFQPQVIDVGAALRSMEPMLRRALGEDIELLLTVDPGVWAVRIDPGHFEQVILNLALNSRDAMPAGGHLFIEAGNVHLDDAYARRHFDVEPGEYAMLAVSDTGIGMDEATRQRVFEPFFTTKPPGRGTGLGLATVYGIVKRSGGSIWVYSEVNRGTTFKIYLPRAGELPVAAPAPEVFGVFRGTETILLVEDEESLRRLAARVLEAAGYRVLVAAGGSEAIDVAARHEGPIALLLTDIVMPGERGPAVARRLLEQRPGMKVLYMSGYAEQAANQNGTAIRGARYIAKPFDARTLTQAVRAALDEPA
jgi:PAS domain S-box-containing protein